MFIPITYSIIYHYQKEEQSLCDAKIIESPEAPGGPLRVLFRFHRDWVLLKFLSDRIFFESSVIDSSSGFSIVDSSLLSSMLFFRHAAIYQNVLLRFYLLKADILFYIIFSKRFAHLTISSKKNLKKYLHDTNTKYILKIYGINSLIYKLSILLNIQQLCIA